MSQVIIGCGTGRCGTKSLAKLLDDCEGTRVTHEMKPLLPWEVDMELLLGRIAAFRKAKSPFVGDVAFYYLPYLPHLIATFPGIRIICLWRDEGKIVESYMAKTSQPRNRNHWMEHDGTTWKKDPIWDPCYPKYDVQDKREAIARYVRDYYETARQLELARPHNVQIFDIENLNSKEGQTRIFDFAGISASHRRYQVPLRINVLLSL